MDKPRVERLTELLDRALDLPAIHRREFVDAECGDDSELRAELTSLLKASDSATGYFDNLAEEIVSPAYDRLRSEIHKVIVGQDRAIRAVARPRTPFRPNRPASAYAIIWCCGTPRPTCCVRWE